MNTSSQILTFGFLVFLFATNAHSENHLEYTFQKGMEWYEKGEFDNARDIFERLTEINPDSSEYFHWLGKCYGRIAENSGWLKAMSMAKKTRRAFEKAVDLDNTNIEALKDLMQYYQDAPGFLGGSNKNARELEKKLKKLTDDIFPIQQ